MQIIQLHNFLEPHVLEGCLHEINQLQLQRYDNPFESKWFLENKSNIGPNLVSAFKELKDPDTCKWISRLLEVPIDHANYTHFGGLFVYQFGDYLRPHVDAGLYQGQRKIATALIYLTESMLQLWAGDLCTLDDPQVFGPTVYRIKPNTCVLFSNTDTAWHGVPVVSAPNPRIVLTLSYMAPPEFNSRSFQNKRPHAYFAREVGENHDLDVLRQQRATDPKNVYRIG